MTESNPAALVQSIFEELANAAPRGWRRLTLKVWASVVVYQLEMQVVMADGSSVELEPPVATETISDLRAMMYHPERGTWFSGWFELRAGEEPEASFNYDNDPAWWPAVPPEVFAQDLVAFPRSPEHVPDWLRDLLADVGELDPGTVPDTQSGR